MQQEANSKAWVRTGFGALLLEEPFLFIGNIHEFLEFGIKGNRTTVF
jgi:hypothetical protein